MVFQLEGSALYLVGYLSITDSIGIVVLLSVVFDYVHAKSQGWGTLAAMVGNPKQTILQFVSLWKPTGRAASQHTSTA